MRDVSWMRDGACRDEPVDVFFPEQPDFREARAVCRRCTVRVECLDYALERPELFGVWGGTSPAERVEINMQRRSQRP
ncbi:MAG: WhiB family transcriptional regulator [Acidimicrobiales bacterium]